LIPAIIVQISIIVPSGVRFSIKKKQLPKYRKSKVEKVANQIFTEDKFAASFFTRVF